MKNIIINKLGLIEDDEVMYNTDIYNDLSVDSLDSVEIAMEIEKEFNIPIKDEDWEKVRTVGDIYQLIMITLSQLIK